MPADIKSILDSIIDGANNKFPNDMNTTMHQNMGVKTPETFDAGKFREKLSLYVLKDIICAMMHDKTKDLDGMIDQSIMTHIRDNYGCGCYDYLCKSRDKLNSPILSGIVQEIDKRADKKSLEFKSKVVDSEDDAFTADAEDMKEDLKNIESYDELRERLKETVANKVVEDVANTVKNASGTVVFDLDNKIEKKSEDNQISDEQTNESTILRICGRIVTEGAMHGIQIPYETGLNAAIVEYCISQMDYLFKQDITMNSLRRWDTRKPIQESFFEKFK